MLEPGRKLERWTIEAVVGQGGMAVVYRVRHTSLENVAALKVLSVPKQTVRDRLIREGRAQAALKHQNIVAVTDVLELDGSPALILEYVDGPSLERWIELHRDTALVESLFRGICAGVAEAHSAGFVHRDLKPGNVLLARTRRGWCPKVTDFGIVKSWLVDEDGLDTKTNVAMGTPYYMAPEQIRDAKHVDPRADVFALGCILYEMISGTKPFTGGDVLEVLNNVAAGRYQPLAPNSASDRLLYVVECCLKIEREERPADADAVLRLLDGEALGQRRQDPPTMPPEPMRTSNGERRVAQPDATGEDLLQSAEERLSDDPSYEHWEPGASTVPSAPPRGKYPRSRTSRLWWVALVAPFMLLVASASLLWVVWPRPRAARPVDDQAFMGVAPRPLDNVPAVVEPDPTAFAYDGDPAKKPVVKATSKAGAPPSKPTGFLFGVPKTGSVLVDGQTDGIRLVSKDGTQFNPGSVPAGEYKVELVDNGTRRAPTSIRVVEGETVRLDCRDRSFGCRAVAAN